MAVNMRLEPFQPIGEISDLLADKPTISFHVDAVQAIGKIPLGGLVDRAVDFRGFICS